MKKLAKLLPMLFMSAAMVTDGYSQTGPALTTANYARAEQMLGYNTTQLADHLSVRPNWLTGDRFWYRDLMAKGFTFILVDAAKSKKAPAFDHKKLAEALSKATGINYNADHLPFNTFELGDDDKQVSFIIGKTPWVFNGRTNTTTKADGSAAAQTKSNSQSNTATSPNGTMTAFIKNDNLWIKETASGKEYALTTDGVKNYGYATDNAGWTKSDLPILKWSPDSKKIATYQQDQRNVSDMYLVTTNVGKPTLQSWKYPLPGDSVVTMIHRVIIEVDQPKVMRLALGADQHRSTQCDDISCQGSEFGDVAWSDDASKLAFVSTSRDHKKASFYIADAATGAIRLIFDETAATQYESGHGSTNWRYLPATNEIMWYSERSNWGHLYLYDATTGKLKSNITNGDWTVTRVVSVDEKNRLVYFFAGGREPGRNPYFSHLYKAGLEGNDVTLLTPNDGNHKVTFSPSGNYFVDSWSKQDVPPVIELRNASGKMVLPLEKTRINRLTANGWKPPTPIAVKANDGTTNLYGLMFTPTTLDLNKKYPVVNYIYPGPQGGGVGSWSFEVARSDHQALAELGFVVVIIEGTCNPLRSKSFHDVCYGRMEENTLPDQIAGIKQLAERYAYIDIDKVGIWGHSGGGYATATAMFKFPDFYKVGISESGNHDNRNYEDDWGERYIGLLTNAADGKTNYDNQANQNFAKNLKGKLLLAHGMLDDNVPPYNTLLVVEALQKANKDYDLIIFPNSRHGYGEYALYMMRRRWDYFVKNLQGSTPPKEYELKSKSDPRN